MDPVLKFLRILIGVFLVMGGMLLAGCGGGSDGAAGAAGDPGAPGVSTGTVTGTVTSDGTHALAGVVVSNNLTSATANTDAAGTYTLPLPVGTYTLSFALKNYTSGTASTSVAAGVVTSKVNATLAATASGKPSVTVTADADEIGFGNTTNVHAVATAPSGGTLSYSWSGTAAPSTLAAATVKTLDLATTLTGSTTPGDAGGYYGAYTQEDRFGILAINPDIKGTKTATVTVNDGLGQSTAVSIAVNAAGISTGLKNVPLGIPVYLNSSHVDPSAWTLTPPTGSTAALKNPTSRNASFTPDVVGTYTLKEGANTMTVYAGQWVGAISGGTENAQGLPSVTPDSNCTVCHSIPTIAPDMFTPWAKTPHATFFATGLNGLTSNNGGCVSCHTVGADSAPLAKNNGFDDLATANNWVYPINRIIGNWKAMWADPASAKVAKMSNIQCESCHGPNDSNTGAHMTTNGGVFGTTGLVTQGVRTSMAAEVCASCHASGTGHHNYSEWNQLDPDTGYGHSNKATAIAEAGSGSCARCHTAQGFLRYLDQINGKVAGNTIGSISTAALPGIVTKANAQPQTCQACHDPHDADAGIDKGQLNFTNPAKPGVPSSSQLRVFGSTPMLPSGFKVSGMGAGALCIVCHNSRNAAQQIPGTASSTASNTLTYLHEDGETYNGGNPAGSTGYSAPHQAAQGDVFAGRNAYFMGAGNLPQLSKHANIEESCVGCHMNLNPQTHLSHGAKATSKHVMYIRDKDKATVCANCHGATDGEALVASIEQDLSKLSTNMIASVTAKLNAANVTPLYFGAPASATSGVVYFTDSGTEVTVPVGTAIKYDGTNPYTAVSMIEIHGQIGFTYTLTNPISVTVSSKTYSVKTFSVGIGSVWTNALLTTNVYPLTGNMVRAGWNYYLIEGDQSKGIHNPGFAQGVLKATLAKDLSN
jgi:hypothetical protein